VRSGSALATKWERGTAFLFAPVLAAGAFAYFAADREWFIAEVCRLRSRRWQS
jgi:hypothetical protein